TKGIVDGVILGGVNYPNLLERMDNAGIAYSIFANNLVGDITPVTKGVFFDDSDGAEQAVEYLARLGHPAIWFIGDTSWPWNARRHDAYAHIMKRRGFRPRAITGGSQSGHELGLQAGRRILEGREPATAIFAGSDYIAAGVIEAAGRLGRRV